MLSFKKQTLQAPMRGIDSDTDITIDQTLINNVFGLKKSNSASTHACFKEVDSGTDIMLTT